MVATYKRPYLSVVVTSRNDDRGGGMLERMQHFIDVLLFFSNRYRLRVEMIIVEWNPPSEAKPLKEVLRWENHTAGQLVRIISVPPSFHNKISQSDKIPLFQFMAKNVGIRRAQGEFILCTNLDIIFSEKMIEFFSSRKLSQECFYRVDRYDIAPAAPTALSPEEILGYCRDHVIRVHTSEGTFPVVKKEFFYKQMGDLFFKIKKSLRSVGKKSTIHVHTVASGDFTLMASEHWRNLRGYPELPSHAYVDGLMCYMAATRGLREVVLRDGLRIYHQEHQDMFLDIGSPRPVMDYTKYLEYCSEMLRKGKPVVFNDEEWGLGNIALSEEIVGYRGKVDL